MSVDCFHCVTDTAFESCTFPCAVQGVHSVPIVSLATLFILSADSFHCDRDSVPLVSVTTLCMSVDCSLWQRLCTSCFSHHFAHVIRLLALHARDGPWNWIYTSFAVQGEHSVPAAFFTTLLIMSVVCLYCPWILHCVRHSPWILHCERHSPWILYLILCCGRCAVCPDVVVVLSRSCSSVYPVHCV